MTAAIGPRIGEKLPPGWAKEFERHLRYRGPSWLAERIGVNVYTIYQLEDGGHGRPATVAKVIEALRQMQSEDV